jgi:hypothetical protein
MNYMLFRPILFIAICISNAALSMTIEHSAKDIRPILPLTLDLDMSGPIEDGDAVRLAAILASYEDSYFREINITLDSSSGSLVDTLLTTKAYSKVGFGDFDERSRTCSEGPLSAAISTGRRNTLSELLCWRLILQGLAGAFVKLPCDCAEFCLGMAG